MMKKVYFESESQARRFMALVKEYGTLMLELNYNRTATEEICGYTIVTIVFEDKTELRRFKEHFNMYNSSKNTLWFRQPK